MSTEGPQSGPSQVYDGGRQVSGSLAYLKYFLEICKSKQGSIPTSKELIQGVLAQRLTKSNFKDFFKQYDRQRLFIM